MPRVVTSRRLRAAGCVLLVAVVLLTHTSSPSAGPDVDPGGQILVKFTAGADSLAIRRLVITNGATDVRTVAEGLHVLRLPGNEDVAAALATYRQSDIVTYAEADDLVAPGFTPDDPGYVREWHLAAIEAPTAWDRASASAVMIAICDTGVSATQPDLVPVLRADLGHNSADGSANWAPVTNHGTLVAGAAAAAVDNAIGVAGVARGASILPIRITNRQDGSASVSDAAACITYAADHGARVINLSFEMAGSAAIDDAARYARAKGALTFVGAGNEGIDPGWPDLPNIIAVGATEPGDTHARYSNYGAFVDISAPGTGIMTTWPDGHYDAASGTSFAAPVAAGVAALIFGANPGLTADQAQGILFETADQPGAVGRDAYFGVGRVNARKAVDAALAEGLQQARAVIASPLDQAVVWGSVVVQAHTSNGSAVGVALYVDQSLVASASGTAPQVSWDTTRVPNGSHTLTLKTVGAAGTQSSTDTKTVVVQNPAPGPSSGRYRAVAALISD